jgi:hypothetical protein
MLLNAVECTTVLESADEARVPTRSQAEMATRLSYLSPRILGNQSTKHHRNMNGEATGPEKTAGAAVPVIIEKRWKSEPQNSTRDPATCSPRFPNSVHSEQSRRIV